MTRVRANEYGFAATHDVPIPYLQRIREYYAVGEGAAVVTLMHAALSS